MTPKAQLTAIAAACGWSAKPSKKADLPWGASATKPDWHYVHQLPAYLSDLNAMHEAEEHAIIGPIARGGKSLLTAYIKQLVTIAEDEPSAMVATAAQRAEAFLKTLNLWDDTK